MKTIVQLLLQRGTLIAVAEVLAIPVATRASERVGVYDSRVLAYACFNTPGHLAELSARQAEGRAAKTRGDTARFRTIAQEMEAEQRRAHLQVFSTAPIPEALAALKDRIATVQKETGVVRLVSKWDEESLRAVSLADRVDVTDELIRDLPLNAKQREVAREIAKTEPLPLAKAEALARAGKL